MLQNPLVFDGEQLDMLQPLERSSGLLGRSVTRTSAVGALLGSSLMCQRIGSMPGIVNSSTSRCQGTRTRRDKCFPIIGGYEAIVSAAAATVQT